MGRTPLYSSSAASFRGKGRARTPAGGAPAASTSVSTSPASSPDSTASRPCPPAAPAATAAPVAAARPRGLRAFFGRKPVLFFAGLLAALLPVGVYVGMQTAPHVPAAEDIEKVVAKTLEQRGVAAPAAKAYDKIRPSVVRVRAYASAAPPQHQAKSDKPGKGKGGGADKAGDGKTEPDAVKDEAQSIGSGVVIVDSGIILTNLHVVAGSKRLKVIFHDGMEASATLIGARPEHDLAVLQAGAIPDDLVAATMAPASELALGQPVMAVGFPFDIGPSVTTGVVSGLNREFRAADDREPLTRLIQFDAAANPGSSGGPLVTMEGDVVGIVTGILNPTDQGFFVGIAFAVPIESAAGAAGLSPF
ncbi:trypsin-like serine protease [Azoarcus indigens]|uniref:Trypsin-like peptidase n=1 Tax=Azoarcus indigens TaxID=29545 RepID=A0A4R6DX11_9RHOO|nr:trypsin-like serine protease [Azoarcus indigens]TDN48908.1 trypsin-like peptidase [Azoarcus indigens]